MLYFTAIDQGIGEGFYLYIFADEGGRTTISARKYDYEEYLLEDINALLAGENPETRIWENSIKIINAHKSWEYWKYCPVWDVLADEKRGVRRTSWFYYELGHRHPLPSPPFTVSEPLLPFDCFDRRPHYQCRHRHRVIGRQGRNHSRTRLELDRRHVWGLHRPPAPLPCAPCRGGGECYDRIRD